MIEIVVAHMRGMQVKQRAENSALFVVSLEELLRKATLLGGQIEQFLIVILGIEVGCQHARNVMASTPQLATDADDNMFIVVHSLLTLDF